MMRVLGRTIAGVTVRRARLVGKETETTASSPSPGGSRVTRLTRLLTPGSLALPEGYVNPAVGLA
jgi:hypothetical protein